MPLSGDLTAKRNVKRSGIKKGDELGVINTWPYANPDGDTYYKVYVKRKGKRLEGYSIVTHKELTDKKDERPR